MPTQQIPTSLPTTPISKASLHGLDWLNFFIADIRTGVGPFIAIYLANNHWSAAQVGVALTAAEIAGVITQAPGGAITDKFPSKRLLVGFGLVVLTLSALAIALFPSLWIVVSAQLALGMTGSIFGPGISAITLGLVGYKCLGARTGRNGAFGSAGNVIAAMTMGYIGYLFSTRAIFFFVALLMVPTMLSLLSIRGKEIDPGRARGGMAGTGTAEKGARILDILSDRRVLILATATIFFHLGNGAMLAQMGEMMAKGRERQSSLWMAAIVTVPQIVMMFTASITGKIADSKGRKPILTFAFIFLPLRALLCAFTNDPYYLVAYQLLDGISAGVFGIVGVLMIADLTQGTGRYNTTLGIFGAAVGVGASISTSLAGWITTQYGFPAAFYTLALFSFLAFLIMWLFMPETRIFGEGPVAAADPAGEARLAPQS